jgi:hypothetical protein
LSFHKEFCVSRELCCSPTGAKCEADSGFPVVMLSGCQLVVGPEPIVGDQ